jgi:hypothetical protein
VDPEQDEMGGHLANDALVEDVALRLRAFVEAEVGTVPVGQQSRARSSNAAAPAAELERFETRSSSRRPGRSELCTGTSPGSALDYVVALDLDRLELLVLNQEIRVLRIFVSAALVRRFDGLPRHVVYELLAEPIAALLVELAERDPLARGRSRVERNRARNEGQLQVALPVGTNGWHAELLLNV